MKAKRKVLACLLGAAALVVAASLAWPLLTQPTNCGGNSYALTACKQIACYTSRLGGGTNWMSKLHDLDSVDRTNFFQLSQSHWTPEADYWVRTNGYVTTTQQQVMVFCDRVFDNVPQSTIWNFFQRNPAHAVGFSDETTGLISPAAFEQLDRHNFAPLRIIELSYSNGSKQ